MKKLLLLLVILNSTASAEIYKWQDESGQIHFSDSASRQRPVETITLKINSYEHISYESMPGNSSNDDTRVVMYATDWCGYCKKARNYFSANGISYTEHDIEKDRNAKRKYDALGGKGVPVILVGDKRMNGFSIDGFNRIYK